MIRIVYELTLSRSPWMLLYLISLHLVILLTLLSLSMPLIGDGIVIISMIASLLYYGRQQQWLRGGKSISKLARYADDRWTVHYQNNETRAALKLTHCVESAFLIVLTFKDDASWQSYSVTIMADAVEAESFRQLRLFCRAPKTFQQ